MTLKNQSALDNKQAQLHPPHTPSCCLRRSHFLCHVPVPSCVHSDAAMCDAEERFILPLHTCIPSVAYCRPLEDHQDIGTLETLMWFTLDYKRLMFIRGTGATFLYIYHICFGVILICHGEGDQNYVAQTWEGVYNGKNKQTKKKELCTQSGLHKYWNTPSFCMPETDLSANRCHDSTQNSSPYWNEGENLHILRRYRSFKDSPCRILRISSSGNGVYFPQHANGIHKHVFLSVWLPLSMKCSVFLSLD